MQQSTFSQLIQSLQKWQLPPVGLNLMQEISIGLRVQCLTNLTN